MSENWEKNEELCPPSGHTALPLSSQGEGRKNRLALWQPGACFVVVPSHSGIFGAGFELERLVAAVVPTFTTMWSSKNPKIYRSLPKNSREIHYLARRLLERSHLQQTGCVKGTHSG